MSGRRASAFESGRPWCGAESAVCLIHIAANPAGPRGCGVPTPSASISSSKKGRTTCRGARDYEFACEESWRPLEDTSGGPVPQGSPPRLTDDSCGSPRQPMRARAVLTHYPCSKIDHPKRYRDKRKKSGGVTTGHHTRRRPASIISVPNRQSRDMRTALKFGCALAR